MARYKAESFQEVAQIIKEKLLPKRIRKWTAFTWKGLVHRNPVDTYTSSNSWIVSFQTPSSFKPEYRQYGGFPTQPAVLRSGSMFKVFGSGKDPVVY
ncbi:MAG: hypothetical protein R3250_00005, partial [Melioribacteraceae bacterium]|nr:hypothetical protein [Melioribacteraceae bacterium]